MERELVILIEKRSRYVEKFLETIVTEGCIPFKELRKLFPSTIAHGTIQSFIYKTNATLKELYPDVILFSLDFVMRDGKATKVYKIHSKVEFESAGAYNVLVMKYEKE